VGTDEEARSPFRRNSEWAYVHSLDRSILDRGASLLLGDHRFIAFAVRGTAPDTDTHRCTVLSATWRDRDGGLVFEVEANRFLHHMVRFLVGTMADAASGRRDADAVSALLGIEDNSGTS